MIPITQEHRIKKISRIFWLGGMIRDDTIVEFYESKIKGDKT